MKKIVLFGASQAGINALQNLANIGFDIEFFVDNDKKKDGIHFCSKVVYQPNIIKAIDRDSYMILISSMYYSEISEQLRSYGFIEDVDFFHIEQFLFQYIHDNINIFSRELTQYKFNDHKKNERTVIITLPSGFTLGGVETLSLSIYRELKTKGFEVKLLDMNTSERSLRYMAKENDIVSIDKPTTFIDYLITLCKAIIMMNPGHLVINEPTRLIMAAYILRAIFPGFVNTLSVLHGDTRLIYKLNCVCNKGIDKFLCVSSKIRNQLIELIPHRTNDVYYFPSPIIIKESAKMNSLENEAVRIAFAGRITVERKRCDLLLKLIDILEEKDIDYELNIAGSGSYFTAIENYKTVNKLENKIKLFGFIRPEEMGDFYSMSDIYLNTSDSEGTCIAMLEAMGYGLVPVVTDVSGVRDFICDKKNGFIAPVGDMNKIADIIEGIYYHRDIIEVWGKYNKDMIKQKTDIKKYMKSFIHELLEGDV
ncbi:MAG: glycosyltransferase family 4 protein [Synergistaceae bacterium]|nr:glycosyltransferase family 4 protein [Synergistaceae bacterium]